MHRSIAIAAAAAFLGMTPTALAQTTEPPAEVNTKYFFQCADQVKVRNGQGAAPWSTAAPTQSFQQGAGCGYADTYIRGTNPGNFVYDAVFAGSHQGPVSDLTVELHDLLLSRAENAAGGGVSFTARLEIDGVEVLNTLDKSPPHEAEATLSSTGVSQKLRFSVNNLRVLDDKTHDYRLTIGKHYTDTAAAWVFGATEIPAGIEFNPATTEPLTIKAPTPKPATSGSSARKAKRGAAAKRRARRA